MRRPIEPRHRIRLEMPALDEPGAGAGHRGLPDAHGAEGQIGLRHAIHQGLNGCRLEIAQARGPTPSAADDPPFESCSTSCLTCVRSSCTPARTGSKALSSLLKDVLPVPGGERDDPTRGAQVRERELHHQHSGGDRGDSAHPPGAHRCTGTRRRVAVREEPEPPGVLVTMTSPMA
jgi:hypothetical protein